MLLFLSLHVLAAMVVVMLAAWAVGLIARNGGWTDVFWAWGTGLCLIGAAQLPPIEAGRADARQWLVTGMAALWTLRLGLYLTPRVASHPEDARYAAFREQWGRRYPLNMLWVTLPQAPATALLSLSVIAAARTPGPLGLRDGAAVALFLLAIAGETVADGQMKRFRANPAHKGEVIENGLWAWSRHPNYFFQWLGWCAYPLIALVPSEPLSWLSLTAPVMMYLLLRYVSGVPPLEEQMLRSRGDKFRDYQARVSVFFPLPPKRARA
jgi:steroid 5-alpha reductase family enzyme